MTDNGFERLDYGFKHLADEQERAKERLELGRWREALFRKNYGHRPKTEDEALIKKYGTVDNMEDVKH
jgi:hypothetical protein